MLRTLVLRSVGPKLAAITPLVVALSALAWSPSSPPLRTPAPGEVNVSTALDTTTGDEGTQPTATAVVVKSWSGCSSDELAWDTLNKHWSQFGDVRLRIDYRNPALCASQEVTYEALEASGAQTVILSDPAGGGQAFDASEVDAITRYVQEGHDLIGTFLTLQSEAQGIDNRGLAPLFGLDPEVLYGRRDAGSGVYAMRPHAPLFDGLGGQYSSNGDLWSQQPPGGRWTNAAAGQARILAFTRDRKAAILQYCGSGFRSILFSQMPEYRAGNAQDQQVLYNALVMGRKPGCRNE